MILERLLWILDSKARGTHATIMIPSQLHSCWSHCNYFSISHCSFFISKSSGSLDHHILGVVKWPSSDTCTLALYAPNQVLRTGKFSCQIRIMGSLRHMVLSGSVYSTLAHYLNVLRPTSSATNTSHCHGGSRGARFEV